MSEDEELKDLIEHVEESIRFFSNHNKKNREIWVVKEFLNNFNINYTSDEIKSVSDDPPDIIFHDASFEIKEILDKDRRRHKKYKEKLERAKKAKSRADLLEQYTPKSATIQEIANLIEKELEDYIISPELCPKIDMLFYVNLSSFGFDKDYSYSFSNSEVWDKWRSVSMVENGNINFVFYADDAAPEYIRTNVGQFIRGNRNL